MSYDPNVPKKLKELQTWFAEVITRPINEKFISSNDRPIEKYIKPSPTLKPEKRIEIYHQQYWWRLLSAMQSTYTMATRMLGYRKFNKLIAIPYLKTYPSEHYSVSHIGDRLLEWMETWYQEDDKPILIDSIAIDDAMHKAFFETSFPSITEGSSSEEALFKLAMLQPHVVLFKINHDLFNFRKEIQGKDPDYWSSHHYPGLKHALSEENGHFPRLAKERIYYFIVYRSPLNHVKWKEISEVEYALLSLFKKPISIEQACKWLSEQGREYLPDAAQHLQKWIQEWIAMQWLRQPN